ncbi:hypothetical protein T11_14951 [Trichinella zimbabwensis]|uniref:Uncharacterized protein n=1 Tax=Trichinella zimbabwensis TaxID=268475 RepID=A0A0V1HVA3_9BILA|nr:hypothetical protein T11_14951 [Trichinella zimbabwensis]
MGMPFFKVSQVEVPGNLKTQGNLITNMLLFMNKCQNYLILGNSRMVVSYEESLRLTDSLCIKIRSVPTL